MTVSQTDLIDASRADRSLLFSATFVAAFAVLLVLAIAGAGLGLNWRSWLPGAESRGSLPGSVTAAVFSFMSYLP
jgi:light-harvesting complex 1 beta chain